MDVRELVRGYYGSDGLSEAVITALSAAGVDVDSLSPDDLYPADQLHAGGAGATRHVLDQLGVRPGMRLLDVGSGIGGPARMAAMSGATVTGIDLTPEFVNAATELTTRVGLAERVQFVATPAETLPFDDGSFDAAMMVHVGMNIPAKDGVFGEVHRVLTPGATFALYEQMSAGTGDLPYPLPWADDASGSFLETLESYLGHLERAGFHIDDVEDRTAAISGPQTPAALGPVAVFGPVFAERAGNFKSATQAGMLRSVLVLASA